MQGINKCKLISVMHHTNKLKDKDYMIISGDANKDFDKIQYPFMIKNSPEYGHRGSLPQHNKGQIQQTHSKHHFQW